MPDLNENLNLGGPGTPRDFSAPLFIPNSHWRLFWRARNPIWTDPL